MTTVAEKPGVRETTTQAQPGRRRGGIRERPNVWGAAGGFAWLVVIILPIYYVVVSSLRSQQGFFATNPLALPLNPTFENYALVLQNDFFVFFRNTLVTTVSTVAVTVAISLMAAYVLVRGTGRFHQGTFTIFLLGLAIPTHATLIPLYWMITRLHLYDTLLALILPAIGFAVPLTVLILSNFVRDIPKELYESMRLDGAGDWRILWTLVVPLSRPALVTVAIYNALNVWNAFLFPLIFTQSASNRVLPMALWAFQGEFSVNVPAILAAVVLSTLPMFAVYILGRRYLVSGLTAGFSK